MDALARVLNQAVLRPNAPAIVDGRRSTSYSELAVRARSAAARFAVRDKPCVLIALPQGSDAVVAMLGAGLAGGFHAPLSPDTPPAKLRRIAASLKPDVIVASGAAAEALHAAVPGALRVAPGAPVAALMADAATRHRLAHVLFTSGSTGEPKGVTVLRSALDGYVDWLEGLGVKPGDRLAQYASPSFDISVTDIFGALCYGGSLHPVASEGDRLLPARFIRREGITVWNSVPSVFSLMIRAGQVTTEFLASIRLFNFAGEVLREEHLAAIFAAVPDALVQNSYGPTEATVVVTCQQLRADTYRSACHGGAASLGEPLPGTRILLRGGPNDEEGEIVITGPQLAAGYWNDPEGTARAFREVESDGERVRALYTGDWAERRDGRVYFRHRLDSKIKLRGYLVELDAVAVAIRACGWLVAEVFQRGDRLAAVVERMPGRPLDAAALRAELAARIEPWAVPEVVVEIERFPRNENDKLDGRAAAAWLEDVLRRRS